MKDWALHWEYLEILDTYPWIEIWGRLVAWKRDFGGIRVRRSFSFAAHTWAKIQPTAVVTVSSGKLSSMKVKGLFSIDMEETVVVFMLVG
eukprot:CAMPEP_0167781636 /NCGR_PEP_ID=MMETSP0111_2-20121227/6046_1 /TAXON_ID=91324 /ORGANISM="Lotharella globosa, Strain CCCM811" /LENGTH=89 /DNA_ID=CAMNT_0007672327 /DNA_START=944 /DNA_END=1213 /DNA_ORIENTATION=-